MDEIFKALADTTRRQLLDRLFADQGQTLGQLCAGTDMRRQSVSKHLNILERANLVSVVWRGREKYYYLNPVPLTEISTRWIDKFSRDRAEAVLRLKQALEDPGQQTQREDSPHEDT
jgi:DNA-binding transcriptional ArsR family regulator